MLRRKILAIAPLVPIRFAPASTIFTASSNVRIPPAAVTPKSDPTTERSKI